MEDLPYEPFIVIISLVLVFYIRANFLQPIRNKIQLYLSRYRRFLDRLFTAKIKQKGAGAEQFLELVDSGKLFRQIFLGVSEDAQDFLYKDPIKDPGVICIGAQGSGKTTTGIGILTAMQMSSSANAFFLIIDSSDKGAGDYSFMFDKDNVATALYDTRKLVGAITIARRELEARSQQGRNIGSFEKYCAIRDNAEVVPEEKAPEKMTEYENMYRGCMERYNSILNSGPLDSMTKLDGYYLDWIAEKNIFRWEKEKLDKLKSYLKGEKIKLDEILYTEEYPGEALFVMVFEEFHKIVNSPEVNFLENCKTPGTLANHMFDLARLGRSWGMMYFLMTQRATYTELPNDLRAGVVNAMIHKLGNANDAQSFDVKTTEVPPIQGRVITPYGFIQFPFFTKGTRTKYLKKYMKPFTAKLFYRDPANIRKSLSGEGANGMIETFPLTEIIHNATQFDSFMIANKIFSEFDFEMVDNFKGGLTIKNAVERDGEKYALIVIKPEAGGRRMASRAPSLSPLKIKEIQDEMKILGIEKSITISFDAVPAALEKMSEYAVGKEDLLRIADVLDNKEKLVEQGNYEEFFKLLPLVRPDVEAAPEKKTIDNLDEKII